MGTWKDLSRIHSRSCQAFGCTSHTNAAFRLLDLGRPLLQPPPVEIQPDTRSCSPGAVLDIIEISSTDSEDGRSLAQTWKRQRLHRSAGSSSASRSTNSSLTGHVCGVHGVVGGLQLTGNPDVCASCRRPVSQWDSWPCPGCGTVYHSVCETPDPERDPGHNASMCNSCHSRLRNLFRYAPVQTIFRP